MQVMKLDFSMLYKPDKEKGDSAMERRRLRQLWILGGGGGVTICRKNPQTPTSMWSCRSMQPLERLNRCFAGCDYFNV